MILEAKMKVQRLIKKMKAHIKDNQDNENKDLIKAETQ